MIAIIRINGRVNLNHGVVETLDRLRLGKKYTCVVINPTKEQTGMINKVRDFIAFGDINKETFRKLVEARGQLVDKKKKVDFAKAADEIEKKGYEGTNLKPFFRLHPPRKGIDTKLHFGIKKGVLGNNKEKINDLILRML